MPSLLTATSAGGFRKRASISKEATTAGCLFIMAMAVLMFVLNTIAFKYNLWVGTAREIGWLGAAGISILMFMVNKWTKIGDINLIGAAAIWILAVSGIVTVPFWTY